MSIAKLILLLLSVLLFLNLFNTYIQYDKLKIDFNKQYLLIREDQVLQQNLLIPYFSTESRLESQMNDFDNRLRGIEDRLDELEY